MKTLHHLLLTACLLAAPLAAQAQRTPVPVVNFEAIPVTLSTDKALSADQVRNAFVAAGAASGWAVEAKGDGRLEATYRKGDKHQVMVAVQYSAQAYSLRYVSSVNMKYAAQIDAAYGRPGYYGGTTLANSAAEAQDKLFAGKPEAPYERPDPKAVIHPFYERWVHDLLAAVRLQLKTEASK